MTKLIQTNCGMIRVTGEWVEAETERVKELLARWEAARSFAGKSDLSFLRALKLLSGARELDPDEPPPMPEDICSVNTTPAFADVLAEWNDPDRMQCHDLPENLEPILRPYQKQGIAFLRNMLAAGFGVCLADDMGLGKTLQILCVLQSRANEGPSLVVAPASVVGNWVAEAARFA
ncbi:MAG: DEAD/DEAH box helicase, partial [Lentisphaeria bacterium]|nr:DEAD/DEAH box helicase [Lentisphaeria bacterium]